jgi:uncharacterized RDD family membrane protein YckC
VAPAPPIAAESAAPTPLPGESSPGREPAAEAPAGVDDDLADILARLGADDDPNPNDANDTTAITAPGIGDELTDPRDLSRPSTSSGIVVDVGSGLEFDPSFATIGQRAIGAIVDTVVITLAVVPGLLITQLGDGTAISLLATAVAVLGVLAVIVLGARSIAKDGKWIGNRVAGTTVVNGINGTFVDQGRAGLRMFGRHVISPVFLFGYLMAFADSERRTFHDRLAGTVVIRRQRETWTSEDS